MRARDGMRLRDFRIVRIEHGGVALELVFKHAHLRRGVVFKRRVPVEMIGREIQQHADFGAKRLESFRAESC